MTQKPKRACLNCGKNIKHKHPKAKFCRSKGKRNCKDKFHNKTNPRGIGKEMIERMYEEPHPFSAEALGQWDDIL